MKLTTVLITILLWLDRVWNPETHQGVKEISVAIGNGHLLVSTAYGLILKF